MENKKLKAVVITAVLCVALCLIGYGAFLFTSGREETPAWASHSIEEYSALAEHYNQAKDLYCQILDLDASIVNAEQGAILSSYDYTQKLDSVEKLLVELEAAKYPAKYSVIYEKLTSWAANDVALYLQYSAMAYGVSPDWIKSESVGVSYSASRDQDILGSEIETASTRGHSQNSSQSFSEAPLELAISMRNKMYSEWMEINTLIVAISNYIDQPEKFADLSWDPNVYFEQKTKGDNANAG